MLCLLGDQKVIDLLKEHKKNKLFWSVHKQEKREMQYNVIISDSKVFS